MRTLMLMKHTLKEVLMIFLLCQRSIDWNHTGPNTMNNYQVILILYIQRILLVTIVTRNIEKRDLSVHLLKDFAIFKGIHGLFHHYKVQAIYRAVNTFKKYHSKLKIGELFKFKSYCDLHISKVSLYDKLNKAFHKFGNRMNHKTFLSYLHNHDKTTWYYDNYDDFAQFWTQGLQMLFLNHLTRISSLKDFSHKVDHFVQGLDMLSTGRLSQTLIHSR